MPSDPLADGNVPAGGRLLAGRLALVTGARGTIGQAIIAAFEEAGARCVGADLLTGDRVLACDVTDETSVAAAFEAAASAGGLTDVVHAAGVLSVGPVEDCSVREFRRVVDVNLVGSFVA